ncbi:MAG: M23 family metallopeptidase [Telluria sp.]
MRFILGTILGAIVGALILFVWLTQYPATPPAPATATVATTAAAPAAAGPAGIVQPASPDTGSNAQVPLPPDQLPKPAGMDGNVVGAAADTQASTVGSSGAAGTTATGSGSVAPAGQQLAASKLMIPVEGINATQLTDSFNQPRDGQRQHEAIDIMAPRGTKVFAAADGKVAKLFNSKPGGLTVYEFDPTGTYSYYYAHLDRYADGLKEGQEVKRGDLLGYVGSTGDADPKAPHLHFAVFQLTPEKQWWKGTAVDPYPMLR